MACLEPIRCTCGLHPESSGILSQTSHSQCNHTTVIPTIAPCHAYIICVYIVPYTCLFACSEGISCYTWGCRIYIYVVKTCLYDTIMSRGVFITSLTSLSSVCMNNLWNKFPWKKWLVKLLYVISFSERVSANARSYQLHWEMRTAPSRARKAVEWLALSVATPSR